MAFETFGLRWISQGAAAMARDLAHIAMGMSQFIGVSQKFEKQVIAAANAQVKAAAQQVAAANRANQAAVTAYNRQYQVVERLKKRIVDLQYAMSNATSTGTRFDRLQDQLLWSMVDLDEAAQKLDYRYDEMVHSGDQAADATENYVDKQKQAAQIIKESQDEMSGLSGAFNILLGKIFPTTNATMQFALKMGMSVPVGRALIVVMNVLSAAANILRFALQAVIGVLGLLLGIVTKIVGAFWNAAKAVTGFVVDSLWRLIKLPFQLAWNGIGLIANSLMRIGEIFIGMNLNNLLWNFGQQVKQLATTVYEAGANFQGLQLRLRALIQREMSETQGISFSASVKVATEKVKELTTWISNLALQTKFSAQDIADVFTLAMAYDFTTEKSKELTLATVRFATGMNLGNNEIRKVIENFGQMRAQGKITGTELRDLARGAFVPVNEILKEMGSDLIVDGELFKAGKNGMLKSLQELVVEGKVPLDNFFNAFIRIVNRDFPTAIENMKTTMEVFTSNIGDFVTSILGWRIVTPVLDAISGHLTAMLEPFLKPEFRQAAGDLGSFFAEIITGLLKIGGTPQLATTVPKLATSFSGLINKLREFAKVDFKKLSKEGLAGYIVNITTSLREFGLSESLAGKFASGITKIISSLSETDFDTAFKKFREGLAEIAKPIWDEVLFPAIKNLMAGLAGGLVYAWTEWIYPALKDLWDNHIYFWLKDLWEVEIPKFWENTAKPELIKLLDKLGLWVDENKSIGENVGLGLVNGITQWLTDNSGATSSVVGQIASVLGSLLSIAASVALDTMSGIIIGSVGGTLSKEEQPSEVPPQYRKAKDTTSGLSSAIEELGKKTRAALDESLNEFKDWALASNPALKDMSDDLAAIKETMRLIGSIATTTLGPVTQWIDIFKRLFGGTPDERNKIKDNIESVNGALVLFNGIVTVATFPMKELGDQAERWLDIFQGKGGTDKSLGQKILDAIVAPFNDIVTFITNFNLIITGKFTDLSDDLVGKSIIPDMMDDIYESISGRLEDVIALFDPASPDGFPSRIISFLSGMDLYSQGVRIATTLYEGLKSMAGQILALLASFGNKTITLTGVAGGTLGTEIEHPITPRTTTGVGTPAQYGFAGLVPGGFENENFIIRASSGEGVVVIPKSEIAMLQRRAAMIPSNITYGGIGNSVTNQTTRQYNLNVTANKPMSSVISDFALMRLVGE